MMTVVVVLAAWVLLSLPAGMLIGSLCARQRRLETRPVLVASPAGVAISQRGPGLAAPAVA